MQDLIQIFKNINIRDIVDMAIIAFVFYKLYMFISETRAEQLIKGILMLLVATQLSEWLQLHAINWILKNTMTVGVIAILIVFQPELRRALEYIGRTKFLTKSIIDIEHEEINIMIEEIAKAVVFLSKEKIGALIVLEKNTGLNEVVETGTLINGRISQELLVNIFMPNSPLHDGAVLIRRSQILAAACFLPLTDSNNLSKDLGTRHRAGIGITERSDAIVVIVSEETGAISIAQGGKLSRFLSVEELKDLLYTDFKPDENKQWLLLKKKWRREDE